jgi:hypothetical protein
MLVYNPEQEAGRFRNAYFVCYVDQRVQQTTAAPRMW